MANLSAMGYSSSPYSEDKLNWAVRSFMVPHSAIRLVLYRFEAGIAGIQNDAMGAVAKLTSLAEWYNEFLYPCIHHHHDIEEKDYFPWLSENMPAGVSLRPEHQHEHLDLMQSMDDFKKDIDNLISLARKDSYDLKGELWNFASKVKTFVSDMREHLDAEEKYICPLMIQHIDEAKAMKKEEQIVQGLGLGGAKLMLPCILEAMALFDPTPEKVNRKAFLGNIPPPLRLFIWASWDGAYVKNNKRVIESLAQGAIPAKKGTFACS